LIEVAAHAIGSRTQTDIAGACARSRMTCFSFHPVKTVTTGEGGAVTTNDPYLAAALRRDRSHGVVREIEQISDRELSCDGRGRMNPWSYEMHAPGLNYRLCDIQAALGLSQLAKLDAFVAARADLKALYDDRLAGVSPSIGTPFAAPGQRPAWHLYPVRIDFEKLGRTRADVMRRLAAMGIGTQVHYVPVHRQPYYAARYGKIDLPGAERHYARTLSLPLFPDMSEADVDAVSAGLERALKT
jgi:dTDP-4-amino-4,6-dideoxygalactose transaminase